MSEATPAAPATPETSSAEIKPTADATPASASATPAVPESGSGPGSAAKRLFKIQVEGQEEEVAEDEVPARLQKARFHEKRSQELARRQAEIDKAFQKAQEKPEEAFDELAKHLGLDVKNLTEQRILRELQKQIEEDELAAMSPAQRQAVQERKELESYRAAEKQRAEAAKQAEQAAKEQQAQAGFEKTLDQAMDYGMKGTRLEGDPWAQFQFASLTAQLAQEVIDGKREDLPNPKQIAAYVEQELSRLAGKFAPPPPPVAPAPTKPGHPQANRPPRDGQPRDPKSGQFKPKGGQYGDAAMFKNEGINVYESLAKTAEKAKDAQVNRFRERFGLPKKGTSS